MLLNKPNSATRRRKIFKRVLRRRLANLNIDLIFIRLIEIPENSKWDALWTITVEFKNKVHTLHSKVYKKEKPFGTKVMRDLVHDIGLWSQQLETTW